MTIQSILERDAMRREITLGIVNIGDVVEARLDDCQLEAAVLREHYLVHH